MGLPESQLCRMAVGGEPRQRILLAGVTRHGGVDWLLTAQRLPARQRGRAVLPHYLVEEQASELLVSFALQPHIFGSRHCGGGSAHRLQPSTTVCV